MKKFLLLLPLLACATVGRARPINDDGTPAPFPEEMAQGTEICSRLCSERNRTIKEYRADGRCVCNPVPVIKVPVPSDE